MVRSSPKRTTILSWYVPANMFPFKKSAGYPNIGRDVTEESAGFAFSNAAISSGGDFFHAIASIIRAQGLIVWHISDRTVVLEARLAERRGRPRLSRTSWRARFRLLLFRAA